jgi:hypothetical protein
VLSASLFDKNPGKAIIKYVAVLKGGKLNAVIITAL